MSLLVSIYPGPADRQQAPNRELLEDRSTLTDPRPVPIQGPDGSETFSPGPRRWLITSQSSSLKNVTCSASPLKMKWVISRGRKVCVGW